MAYHHSLSDDEKRELLRIARATLREFLSSGRIPPGKPHKQSLLEPAGAFVTLHKGDELRGCIGTTQASTPLYKTIQEMAVAAATRDPRFKPVAEGELPELTIEVSVLGGHSAVASVADIDRLYVRNANGEMTPVSAVARVEYVVGPQSIVRYNNYRSVTLNGSPAPGVASGAALAAMEEISARVLPPGYGFEWTGTALQEKEAAGQTTSILALALLFAYLFLVALYESWTIPVPVLLSVSVGVAGALLERPALRERQAQHLAGVRLDRDQLRFRTWPRAGGRDETGQYQKGQEEAHLRSIH